MRHTAGKLTYRLHLLPLRELRFELALFCHIQGVDVGALGRAGAFLRPRDVEPNGPIPLRGKSRVNRIDLRAISSGGGERVGQCGPVAVGQQIGQRPHLDALLATGPAENPAERRVAADDPPGTLERHDGERRVVEEAREPHLGGAQLLLGTGRSAAAVEHQRARLAELAIG